MTNSDDPRWQTEHPAHLRPGDDDTALSGWVIVGAMIVIVVVGVLVWAVVYPVGVIGK